MQLGYLFPWPRWPLGCYGMSAGAGDWEKAMSERREVTCDPLEMGAAGGDLLSDVDETGGFDLEELRERSSVVNLPTSLVKVACGFPGSLCRS